MNRFEDFMDGFGVVGLLIILFLGMARFTGCAQVEQFYIENASGVFNYYITVDDAPVSQQMVSDIPYRGEALVDNIPVLSLMGLVPARFTWSNNETVTEVATVDGTYYQTVSLIILADITRPVECETPYGAYFRLCTLDNLGNYSMDYSEVAPTHIIQLPEGIWILYGEIYTEGNIYSWSVSLTDDRVPDPEGQFGLSVHTNGITYNLEYAIPSLQMWVNAPLLDVLPKE